MTEFKIPKVYLKIRKPRLDVVQFAGKLHKNQMLEPQVVEYTYTGKETVHQGPLRYGTNVKKWEIQKSRRPQNYEMEFLKVKGNYFKAQFRLLRKEAFSPLTTDPDHMNIRMFVYAHMNPIKLEPVKFVSSKTSKIYHKSTCFYSRRILIKTDKIEGKRQCRRCS